MLRHIFAYHLAILVLLTNLGIPVFTHICHGQGREWSSLLLPARSCCSMKKEVKPVEPCHGADQSCEKGIRPKPCCENKASLAQLHSTFMFNLESWTHKKLEIAAPTLYFATSEVGFSTFPSTCISFQPHAPPVPLHGRSLLVSKQVFRC